MNTGTKIALGIGIPIAAIVIIAVVAAAMAGIEQGETINEANLQQQEYCNNWRLQLEQQRSEIAQEDIPSWVAFNERIDAYNSECGDGLP